MTDIDILTILEAGSLRATCQQGRCLARIADGRFRAASSRAFTLYAHIHLTLTRTLVLLDQAQPPRPQHTHTLYDLI